MTLAQEVYLAHEVTLGTREELHCMLQFRRPHNSIGEADFTETYLLPHEPLAYLSPAPAAETLAYVLLVPNADGTPSTTLFSCHVDTVHSTDTPQVVDYDPGLELFYKTDGAVLGADDGAGVWLMLCMYRAGVPGSYVFHRGEEKGGIGSSGMAKWHESWIAQHTHAIAFDRKGEDSIITHQQWGAKGCSSMFADELASRLNASGVLRYEADSTGVFTDTANYFDLISECTNLSCGYDSEHTARETLDWNFLAALRDVVVTPETWANLPALRDPGDTFDASQRPGFDQWRGGGGWGGHLGADSETDWDYSPAGLPLLRKGAANDAKFDAFEVAEELRYAGWADLRKFVGAATPLEMTELLYVLFDELNSYEQDLTDANMEDE